MANVVWKYELEIGRNEIELPAGAHILSAVPREHGGVFMGVFIYAMVNGDPTAMKSKRIFRVTGTGVPAEELQDLRRLRFIATVQRSVWAFHVFEVKTGGV